MQKKVFGIMVVTWPAERLQVDAGVTRATGEAQEASSGPDRRALAQFRPAALHLSGMATLPAGSALTVQCASDTSLVTVDAATWYVAPVKLTG